jgi:hypothetical protein
MKRVKIILFLAVIILINVPIATVYATAGQWSANGSSIYYNDGKLGLGTSNPNDPLVIQNTSDNSAFSGQGKMLVGDNAGSWWMNGNTKTDGSGENNLVTNGYNSPSGWFKRDASKEAWIMQTRNTSGVGTFRIYHQDAGGTTAMSNIANLFEINGDGTVFVKALIVQQSGWPDYVFSKDYNLKPLLEVDKYIQENKHLPDVPSEDEVKKNGLSIGDMQSKQMKKIEELTLYIIDLQKQIDQLKK